MRQRSVRAERIQIGYLARYADLLGLARNLKNVRLVELDKVMMSKLAVWWHYARHAPSAPTWR